MPALPTSTVIAVFVFVIVVITVFVFVIVVIVVNVVNVDYVTEGWDAISLVVIDAHTNESLAGRVKSSNVHLCVRKSAVAKGRGQALSQQRCRRQR